MAIFRKLEDLISGTSLENVIVKELVFKEEDYSDPVKKGSLSIQARPSFKVNEKLNKIILDLRVLVQGFSEGEGEDGPAPVFTVDLCLNTIFDVVAKYDLAELKDMSEEPEFIIDYMCRQIYPIARVKLHEVLSNSVYMGVQLPWQVTFEGGLERQL